MPGTLLSIATCILAIALIGVPFGPHFYVLIAVLVLFFAAAIARSNAAWFFAAGMFTVFVGIARAPFAPGRKFMNVLKKAGRDGDETAQSSFDFYSNLADSAFVLELALIALILVGIIIGARRATGGAHQFIFDASEGLGQFTMRIGRMASILFIPMMVFIFYDVVQRKYVELDSGFADSALFRTLTSTKLQETQWHLHAILFLLCFGFAYLKDAHVRIELVRDLLLPRTRVWIELIGCTIFLMPYCFLVYAYGFDFARKSFEINEVSAALTGLPYRWIIKSFLPIGFTVLGMAALSVWLKCFVYLFGPPDLREQSAYYGGTHHADIPDDAREAGPAISGNPGNTPETVK